MAALRLRILAGLAAMTTMTTVACTTTHMKPIARVAHVDLPRFMGDWYVIAHVPSYLERNAYDAVESYELAPDGRIATTFRYRNGAFDSPLKTMNPVGTVRPDTGNAVWGMQFIWPIQAEYVVVHLNDEYTQTIVGRSKRDYAWIMARSPQMPEPDLAALLGKLEALGYDLKQVRRVPHAAK